MALTTSPERLGFKPEKDYPKVYGVLTDWNMGDVTVSILALKDGAASLYTTSTFGVIGGEGHDAVRQAAERCVKMAGPHYDDGKAVADFAYPKKNQVYFYLLTYDGVRLCIGDVEEIDRGTDRTASLFGAAQDVLTQLRLATEKKTSEDAQH